MKTKALSKARSKSSKVVTPAEPELSERSVDGFIARNRDALNASIKKSRQETAEGVFGRRTIAQIIADERRRARAKNKD